MPAERLTVRHCCWVWVKVAIMRPRRIRLLEATKYMVCLDEGDVAELAGDTVELGSYAHCVQKEFFEQSSTVANTLETVFNAQSILPNLFGKAVSIFSKIDSILIRACSTSYYAGLPCHVEIASEYRYREPIAMEVTPKLKKFRKSMRKLMRRAS